MNPSGRVENLQSQQFGNTNAVTHGAFSRRTLAPRAREVAEALLEAPHTIALDRLAAEEIGAIVALIEAIDEDLLTRGLTDRRGKTRPLVELRIRVSGRLERWLAQFAATPLARLQWLEELSQGHTFADLVRSEFAEGLQHLAAAQDRGDVAVPDPGTST